MTQAKRQHKALAELHYDLFVPEDISLPAPATIDSRLREFGQRSEVAISIPDDLSPPDLPSEMELYRRFDLYNREYFDGKLPRTRIGYSTRMLSAGSYTPSKKLITISRKYHRLFPREINDTLKHEMIHIVHFKHDAAFKEMAARIGSSVKANSHPDLKRPPRYVYFCSNCSLEYPRRKRLIMASCGRCSPGKKYDIRYKLKLVRSDRTRH